MNRLETDVAFLPFRVVGARLDRERDGLFVFFVGVVLFRVAAAVYFLADLLVPEPVGLLSEDCNISLGTARIAARRGPVGRRSRCSL